MPGFELPPDNPIQILAAQAEMIVGMVATYHTSLIRNGIIDDELIGELTLQYGEHMLGKLYPTGTPPTPPTVDE